MELCPALGVAIPVGKDSLSMKTVWSDVEGRHEVTAPLTLVISAFAPVRNVRRTLTPQLRADRGDTDLVLVDLGKGRNRLGGSALAQVHGALGHHPADLDDPHALRAFFTTVQELNADGLLMAYHDRSDGGLFATLCEMAFAGHTGVSVELDGLGGTPLAALFAEEPGAVMQVAHADTDDVIEAFRRAGLGRHTHVIGTLGDDGRVVIRHAGREWFADSLAALRRAWSETSYRLQALRDHPRCAQEAFEALTDAGDTGLSVSLSYDVDEDIAAPFIRRGARPRIAILREQGVNGHVEMAAAFDRAGFEAVDVHMTDLVTGRHALDGFHGLVACGGFSFGDVLGAGRGWASAILHNVRLREAFQGFFARPDRFALGVCNGCQMMAELRDIVPGADHWPRFLRNTSEQFEARLVAVEVLDSPSILFAGMAGSRMPIVVAHGEGRAGFADERAAQAALDAGCVPLRYIDHRGVAVSRYPFNPNGSPLGITGLTNTDGRITILMPHPERVFRAAQSSWLPDGYGEDAPWMRLFRNARVWLG